MQHVIPQACNSQGNSKVSCGMYEADKTTFKEATDVCLGPRPCSQYHLNKWILRRLDAIRTQAGKTRLRQGPTPEPRSASATVPERLCVTFSCCLVVGVQVR
jgi:hypothetical protein